MGTRGRKSAASLSVVTPDMPRLTAAGLEPPRPLGEAGRACWDRMTRDYDISDAGSMEVLAQACHALDMAERCAAETDTKTELQCRALAARLIGRLTE